VLGREGKGSTRGVLGREGAELITSIDKSLDTTKEVIKFMRREKT
jgi:hypothetical protein